MSSSVSHLEEAGAVTVVTLRPGRVPLAALTMKFLRKKVKHRKIQKRAKKDRTGRILKLRRQT